MECEPLLLALIDLFGLARAQALGWFHHWGAFLCWDGDGFEGFVFVLSQKRRHFALLLLSQGLHSLELQSQIVFCFLLRLDVVLIRDFLHPEPYVPLFQRHTVERRLLRRMGCLFPLHIVILYLLRLEGELLEDCLEDAGLRRHVGK